MASTFGSYEIAKSGMMTYSAALQTTAHNIANIETKGYSKQTTNYTSMVSNKSSLFVQGSGVQVTSITRNRNEYYDEKYQSTQSTYNYYNTQSHYLNLLQDYICGNVTSKDNVLLGDSFDDFYASLSSLLDSPSDMALRTKSVTLAKSFTESVNTMASNLQALQQDANQEIKTSVEQINAYADKIASLNKQINMIEAYGSNANDLRDQRSLLLDELSQYCKIETQEVEPPDGVGGNQFYVYVNGGVLVDTYNTNHLEISQKDTYSNISDITGCFEIQWSDGTSFNPYSNSLGGRLQYLFEFRDGNNGTTLEGTLADVTNNADGNLVLTITGANINDLTKLNIPAADGEIVVRSSTYAYESFTATVADDGTYTYTFTMKSSMNADQTTALKNAVQNGYTATVGKEVNTKGVPYYMAQLNEFVRTFAQEFNRIQNEGYTLENQDHSGSEHGMDFFNGTVAADGENFILNESVNGVDPSFDSIPKKNADGTYTGSYYYMNALNFTVSQDVIDDPALLACKSKKSDEASVGNENGENLKALLGLKDDSKMFLHGDPDSFLSSLTATLGVEGKKASTMSESQNNILYAIDHFRKSTSGVDEDEEGTDMVTFQNMLNYQYKVLAVLNEVIDRLINDTV